MKINLSDLKQNEFYIVRTHKISNRFFKNDGKSKMKIKSEKEEELGKQKAKKLKNN